MSNYPYVAIIYSTLELGIIGEYNFVLDNLEKFNNVTGAGVMFVVGTTKNNFGIFRLHYKDFFELWSLKLLIRTTDHHKGFKVLV